MSCTDSRESANVAFLSHERSEIPLDVDADADADDAEEDDAE